MDTMEITKIVAGICGSLLVFLGVKFFVAEPLYETGGHGHQELAYALEIEDDEATAEAEPEEEEVIDYAELVAAADPDAGESDFRKCQACHQIEPGQHGVGPSLHAVLGREVGGIGDYTYSAAMASVEGEWSAERLAEFLHQPKEYVPGTKMAFAGYRDPADAADMAAYLATLE